jgi:hypothetical protein
LRRASNPSCAGRSGGPVVVTDPYTPGASTRAATPFLATEVPFIKHIAMLCGHTGAHPGAAADSIAWPPESGHTS